jgi:thiol:disulfide interchange protein DsbD
MYRSTLARHVAVIAVLLGFARAADAAEIAWYTNLEQAIDAARKSDRPMFIDFWADWCAACKIMDADVYTDPKVIEVFERKIVGVRIHFDLQQDMARRFGVEALPYLVFTTSYGTPLVHHRGLLDAPTLTRVVEALPPLGDINRLDRALQEDRNDFASLLAMARALRASALFESSNGFYDRASKHRAAREDAVARESILYDMALNALELQDGKRATELLEKCLMEFPASPRRSDVQQALERARARDAENDRIRKESGR